jgi:hypothetical protein
VCLLTGGYGFICAVPVCVIMVIPSRLLPLNPALHAIEERPVDALNLWD